MRRSLIWVMSRVEPGLHRCDLAHIACILDLLWNHHGSQFTDICRGSRVSSVSY